MANTLNLGNGDWATKENSLLGYNSENGNYKPLPFDFTRASNGTFINKSGLIETAASGVPRIDFLGNTSGALLLEPQRSNLINYSSDYTNPYWTKSGATIQADATTAGSELVTNGDFATDTDWTKETGWTISGGTANSDGTSSASALYQNLSLTTGSLYKLSFKVTNYVSGSFKVYLSDGQQIGATDLITSNGNYTFYIAALGALCLFRNVTNFIGSIDNVSVKEVQGFASPDGTTNAYKLVEGTNNGVHYVGSSNIGVTLGNDTTFSVFVKKGESNFIQLLFSGASHSGSNYANFDLLNGVLGSVGGGVAKIEFIGGFYRCSFTSQATATTATNAYIWKIQSATSPRAESYTGDGTSGVYIYGAQLELGSYSTSLINTSGSAVTRVSDACSQTVPDGIIGQTEGTMYWEGKFQDGQNPILMQIVPSSANYLSSIYIDFNKTINLIRFHIYDSGVIQATLSTSATPETKYKIALAYKQNDIQGYVNGVSIGSDTNATIQSGLNNLIIGGLVGYVNNNTFIGTKPNNVRLYNTRLSNAELAALTTI